MKARSVGTFVQIGDLAINMALVSDVNFSPLGDESVCLYFSRKRAGIPPIVLRDDARLAFLDWWERQAVQSGQPYVYTTHEPSDTWETWLGEE